jgi:hypothetical protein
VYLDRLRAHAGWHLAAEQAGVAYRTALRHRHADPAFDEACEDARQLFADRLINAHSKKSLKTGNPLFAFGLLKAVRPREWIERHLQMTVNVDVEGPSSEDVKQMLALMLGGSTAETRRLLVEPQAAALPPPAGGGA